MPAPVPVSRLALTGIRYGTLGSAASLAMAFPLAEGQVGTDAHTAAGRIGYFASRTAGAEQFSIVVMGQELFRAGFVSSSPRVVIPSAAELSVQNTDPTTTLGTGALIVSGGVSVAGDQLYQESATAGVTIGSVASSTAATSTARKRVISSNLTALDLLVGGPSAAASVWGTTTANSALLLASGASLARMQIGVNGVDVPIQIGINASTIATFSGGALATGSLTINYTTASSSGSTGGLVVAGGIGAGGMINATGGFQALMSNATATNVATFANTATSGTSTGARLEVSARNASAQSVLAVVDAYAGTNTATTFGQNRAYTAGFFVTSTPTTPAPARMFIGPVGVTCPITIGVNNAEVMRINGGTISTGTITVFYSVASSSSTTGALIVNGGIGIAKATFIDSAGTQTGVVLGIGTRTTNGIEFYTDYQTSGAGGIRIVDDTATTRWGVISHKDNVMYLGSGITGIGNAQLQLSSANNTVAVTNGSSLAVTSSYTAAAGTIQPARITPTMVLSGTAGYDALLVSVTETSLGSGAAMLIRAAAAGTTRFTVSRIGDVVATGSLTTDQPSANGAGAWLLGKRVAATVAALTTQYIEVSVDGTVYRLGTVA